MLLIPFIRLDILPLTFPPSAASVAEKGGRVVRKIWSRLDGLGRGFGVRWSIEIRKEGLRRTWVCTAMVQSDSILFMNNRKRGPLKEREPYVALTSQGVLNKWDCMIKGFRLYILFRQNRNPSLFNNRKAGGHIKAVYKRLTWAFSCSGLYWNTFFVHNF